MKIAQTIMMFILLALFSGVMTDMASANVPGVAINAPPPPPAPNVAVQGGQGLVTVVVTHRDTFSPSTHYIDHLYLYDGDKLLKDWRYTEKTANPNMIFTESILLPMNSDMHLRAIAHCTLHGFSSADVLVRALPQGTTPTQMVNTDTDVAGFQVNGYSDPSVAVNDASQSAGLIQQIERENTPQIQGHVAETADFLKTSQGQQFLKAFDYQKNSAGGLPLSQAPPSVGLPQDVYTDSAGNVINGVQVKMLGNVIAAQPGAD